MLCSLFMRDSTFSTRLWKLFCFNACATNWIIYPRNVVIKHTVEIHAGSHSDDERASVEEGFFALEF